MRILVVSHVFPGEFGQLAAALAAAGHEVIFAAAHGRREARIPGVRHMDLRDVPLRRPPEGEEDPYGVALAGRILDRTCARARDGARRLVRLRAAGWEPQIVCCSAAHGNGLLARGLFPQAFFVVYGEWYTAPEGEAFAPQAVGNLLQAAALGESHLAFTSTDWQRTRYPEALAQRLEVWPRCVDTAFFSPPPVGAKAPEEELITFSGRGMESPQAFLRLLAGLPHLLERRPAAGRSFFPAWASPCPKTARQSSGPPCAPRACACCLTSPARNTASCCGPLPSTFTAIPPRPFPPASLRPWPAACPCWLRIREPCAKCCATGRTAFSSRAQSLATWPTGWGICWKPCPA